MTAGAADFLFLALLAIALLRTMMPRSRAERHDHQLHRRRAQWLTVSFSLVAVYLTFVVVRALVGSEGVNPLGLVPFLLLCVHLALGRLVLGHAWRNVSATRKAEEALDPTLERVPQLEEPPRFHRGLSGEDEPPTRW